jgi:hypothetical protein
MCILIMLAPVDRRDFYEYVVRRTKYLRPTIGTLVDSCLSLFLVWAGQALLKFLTASAHIFG